MNKQHSFEAIGTQWVIELRGAAFSIELQEKIQERIEVFDRTYSRFRQDSWVTELSQSGGSYELPNDAYPLLRLYTDLYQRTDGLVTPLVGQLLSEAGYDADYSLETKKLSSVEKWDEVVSLTEEKIILRKPVLLDFGAAGKGYLVDLIGEVLLEKGVDSFLIDAGGDILQRSKETHKDRIGLEHPVQLNQVIGVVEINNQSVCGSASNRRKWGDFHHVMNPHTLQPVEEIIATWVVAKSAMIADALATALFFVEPAGLLEVYDFEYLTVNKDYSFAKSDNFPGELFTN